MIIGICSVIHDQNKSTHISLYGIYNIHNDCDSVQLFKTNLPMSFT